LLNARVMVALYTANIPINDKMIMIYQMYRSP